MTRSLTVQSFTALAVLFPDFQKLAYVKQQNVALPLCLCQKIQKHPLKQKIWTTKKYDVKDFLNAPSLMFVNFQKK